MYTAFCRTYLGSYINDWSCSICLNAFLKDRCKKLAQSNIGKCLIDYTPVDKKLSKKLIQSLPIFDQTNFFYRDL